MESLCLLVRRAKGIIKERACHSGKFAHTTLSQNHFCFFAASEEVRSSKHDGTLFDKVRLYAMKRSIASHGSSTVGSPTHRHNGSQARRKRGSALHSFPSLILFAFAGFGCYVMLQLDSFRRRTEQAYGIPPSLDITQWKELRSSPRDDNHTLPRGYDKELLFQSALNTLSCFITSKCFPRWRCRHGVPKKIQRRKVWEEMSFCTGDLQARSEELKSSSQPDSDEQPTKCLVYSFGIERSIEWERKIARYFDCEVHAFDPTTFHKNTSQLTFHQLGLQGEGTNKTTNAAEYKAIDPSRLLTLTNIMKRLGHGERTIDVLMLDCEGCEWGVLHQLACNEDRSSRLVDQILLELHFQKSLGLATENDVIMAAKAINCLRRDGWGMVTQEKSGCHADNARYTRGVHEILPTTNFLMYTSLQRIPPESTTSLNDEYERWIKHRHGQKWTERLVTIKRKGRIARRGKVTFDQYDRFEEPETQHLAQRSKNWTSKPTDVGIISEQEIASLKPPSFVVQKSDGLQ